MRVQESPLRDVLRLLIWYPFRWCIRLLPASMALWCITRLGDVHYSLSNGKRARLAANIRRLQPQLSEHAIAREIRQYLRVHYLNQLIIFVFPSMTPMHLAGILQWEGLEHLEQALAQQRGVILAHPHLGPVHLPLFGLGTAGYAVKQIGNPSDAGLSWIGRNVAFRLRLYYESKIPAEIIPVGSDYRKAFRHLRTGNIIMITADGTGNAQEEYGPHLAVPFCGWTVRFPKGPASLALRTGAVLLPMFLHPGAGAAWQCTIEEPIPLKQTADSDATVEAATRELVLRYEKYAMQYPGCMHFLDGFAPGLLIRDDA